VLIESRSCFAWLPTLTSVSKQSIFAGNLPRTFAGTLGTTSAEPAEWLRLWEDEGLSSRDISYAKSIGLAGSRLWSSNNTLMLARRSSVW
jgi:hypothetical protein